MVIFYIIIFYDIIYVGYGVMIMMNKWNELKCV